MKRLFLFSIYTCLCLGIVAQPTIEWQKLYGGINGGEGSSFIKQTIDGGYIISGTSTSSDGDVGTNYGADDYWIIKTNVTGDIEWQQNIGGSFNDQANCIEQTSDGGYIVAGYSNSGDLTGTHGGGDYMIVKLSSSGSVEWFKLLGGSDTDRANSIKQTPDGGYIVAGSSYSNDGDVTNNHGNADYWVVKLTDIGNISWEKSYGGSGEDIANSIDLTLDGGYIVTGHTWSFDGDISSNQGFIDYWVLKLNVNGVIEWDKTYGGSLVDDAISIQQTNDNGFIIAGNSESSDGQITNSFGNVDYWVVKTSNNGTIEWEKSLGGSYIDRVRRIEQTSDNGYILCGESYSTDGNITNNHGGGGFLDC